MTKSYNIHFCLDDKAIEQITKINGSISAAAENFIDFKNTHIPHISILNFSVDESDENAVLQALKDELKKVPLPTFKFEKITIKDQWIFLLCDYRECKDLVNLYENLVKKFGSLITPSKHAMSPENPPHITLGYLENPQKAKMFDNQPCHLVAKAVAVEILPKHEHGTLLQKELQSIPMKCIFDELQKSAENHKI